MVDYWNASHAWDPALAPSVLDPPPTSHDELRARNMALYKHGIETGRFEAFLWPHWIAHFVVFAVYFMLVPPCWLDAKAARGSAWRRARRWMLLQAKYPLFLVLLWRTFVIISTCRSPTGTTGYSIGFSTLFLVSWFSALFIFREPRLDCMRLEKVKTSYDEISVQKDHASSTGVNRHGEVHSRRRAVAKPERQEEYRYHWQGLPSTLGHRAAWVMDLVTSVRGGGWAHQIRTLPMPPAEALAQLPASSTCLKHAAKRRRLGFEGPGARARLLRHNLASIATAYVILDLFQSFLVMHDPYFSGLVDAPFPPGLLPRVLAESPIFVRGLRTLASGTGIVVGMIYTFTIFSTLHFLCRPSDDVRSEPWMWADVYGHPRVMLDHGLGGLWGESWHQAMRITFSAPGEAISTACGWDRRDPRARAITTVLAFVISGSLHAFGSYTQLGPTQPIKQFLFFTLQGLGILVETLVGSMCAKRRLQLPERYMRVVRGAWAAAFLCYTAPLFADDMARGAYWTHDPLHFSLVRGLGLGPVSAAGWSRLHGSQMWWHRGHVWWKSGLAT